jgi:hypothetical protein
MQLLTIAGVLIVASAARASVLHCGTEHLDYSLSVVTSLAQLIRN